MIEFEIYETFNCIGFDLHYTGDVSYFYKNKELISVDVDLRNILLEVGGMLICIKDSLPKEILNPLQDELEKYFWNSDYWEEKYADAIAC